MRLFIAFKVSKEVEEHSASLQKILSESPARARLNLAKSFHLTLKFLGEVTPQKAEQVKEKLKEVKFKSFTAVLNGAGFFPGKKYVRVVWVGIEPAEQIIELQEEIEKALKGLFPKEKRFHPHITLARVKNVEDKNAFIEQIQSLPVEPLKFAVKEIALIESKLSPEGPKYTTLAVFPAQTL